MGEILGIPNFNRPRKSAEKQVDCVCSNERLLHVADKLSMDPRPMRSLCLVICSRPNIVELAA